MSSVLLLALVSLLGLAVLVVLVGVVVWAATRRGPVREEEAPPLPPAPLSEATVAEISGLVARDKKIQAIKVLREATGLGLKEAKDRVDRWSDVMELRALDRSSSPGVASVAALPDQERLAVEASAIMTASGWHTAETFLREQRGLSADQAKSLLDSLDRSAG